MGQVRVKRTVKVESAVTFGTMIYEHEYTLDEKDVLPGDVVLERLGAPAKKTKREAEVAEGEL